MTLAAYLALLLGGLVLFLAVREFGQGLSSQEPPPEFQASGSTKSGQVPIVLHVLGTLAAVLALGHLLGEVCRWLGQPAVIGQIFAGIALGPSLLGAISPEAANLLVPSLEADPKRQVASALKAISQLGVILYMFLVGLDLNAAKIKKKAGAAVFISHASIVVPFVLGGAMALWLYPSLSHTGVRFTSFALFLGVALSITAFPVLARILEDQKLEKSELGTMALSCAAADDVTAWCLLALVVGVAESQPVNALLVIVAAGAFVAAMFFVVKPLLLKVVKKLDAQEGPLPPWAIAGTFLLLILSALATEAIHIHAVFGAFLFGAILPHESKIAREFTAMLKNPVGVLLLPAFFAVAGMRTQLGLLGGWESWLVCLGIIAVATLGKFGGTYLAARFTGYPKRLSAALGILMNTRGLMGLIVLDIGLDMGVIGPKLFALMVIMALVTTVATAPVVKRLINGEEKTD